MTRICLSKTKPIGGGIGAQESVSGTDYTQNAYGRRSFVRNKPNFGTDQMRHNWCGSKELWRFASSIGLGKTKPISAGPGHGVGTGPGPLRPCRHGQDARDTHGRDAHATGHGHAGRDTHGRDAHATRAPGGVTTSARNRANWGRGEGSGDGAQRPDTRTSNPGPWAFDKRSELPSGRHATRANREIGGPGDAGPAGDVSHCPTIPIFHHSSVPAGCRLEERSRFRKEFQV